MRKPSERTPAAFEALHHMAEPAVAVAEVKAAEAFGVWLDAELPRLELRWAHLVRPVDPSRTFGEPLRGS